MGNALTLNLLSVRLDAQVYVSAVEDPRLGAFCESYESAHSLQGLTGNIARVSWVLLLQSSKRDGPLLFSSIVPESIFS